MTATKKLYIWLAAIIVGLQSFMAYSNASVRLSRYAPIFNLVMIATMVGLGVLYIFVIDNRRLQSNIVFLGLLFLLLVIFRKMFLLQLVAMLILFTPLLPVDVFDVYRKGILVSILITFVTGILIGQLHNTNTFTGIFTFGFGNENQTGFYFGFLIIAWLFKIDGKKLVFDTNWLKNSLFIIILFYQWFVIEDFTAFGFMIVTMLLIVINKYIKHRIYYLSIVLPIGMMYLSYWLAMNYADTNWTYQLNKIVTMRPQIWNWYFTHYPISLWGGNQIQSVVSSFGYNYTPGQGLFDGSYAFLLYSYGIVYTIIFVVGLTLANVYLIKNKLYYLFFIMLGLELVGFSENILFSTAFSFGAIFALMAFNPGWFKQKQVGEIDES